jgi:hypothetical protein
MMRTAIITALTGLVAAAGVALAGSGSDAPPIVASADPSAGSWLSRVTDPVEPKSGHGVPDPRRKVPSAAALRSAQGYAADRAGPVSLAVINTEGRLRGWREDRRYAAASVVKAMLLAAEIRRLKHAGARLDSTTDSLLTAMITVSDNGAADSIYARVGDEGLFRVAERAGMKRFTVAGYWGNAQIAAADMARFFGDLDHAFPRRFREYAKGLLGSVVESQSWGIPAAAGDRWAVRFKGGWLPDHALVHQAAELRERDRARELAIVVLTDDQPSFAYGVETVRGVAERLLSRSGDP